MTDEENDDDSKQFYDDLDASEIQRVQAFMAEYIQACESTGRKILSWEAHRFRLPMWGVSVRMIYEPAPTIWIKFKEPFMDMELASCFAIAPDNSGAMQVCDERGLTPLANEKPLREMTAAEQAELRVWLTEPRTALTNATLQGIRQHVATLREQGIAFYGYALIPGDYYDVSSIGAVYNTESDLQLPKDDAEYNYYRYCVNEWQHWFSEGYEETTALLKKELNSFDTKHFKPTEDCTMDEFQIAHSETLIEAIVRALELAKAEGVFGKPDPFLCLWFPDTNVELIPNAVKRLNTPEIFENFLRHSWYSSE